MIIKDLLKLVSQERKRQDRAKTTKKLAMGMSFAATLGAVAGMLFAPKSGKETREEINKKATTAAEVVKDTIEKNIEQVKENANKTVRDIGRAVDDIQEKTEELKAGYEEIKNDFSKKTEDIFKK
ncbi:MAG: YtxH domain-containing protein [Peptococcaceae bacterium]|nr:YtxH domain-containing protein [Peptococcaceae bacterium]